MTDERLIQGIRNNEDNIWRYIYRTMREPIFAHIGKKHPSIPNTEKENIFQDTCLIVMENIVSGKYVKRENVTLRSYFLGIIDNLSSTYLRKYGSRIIETTTRRTKETEKEIEKNRSYDSNIIIQLYKPAREHNDADEIIVLEEERQLEQNRFIDQAFGSLSATCQSLFKRYYWDGLPMDEIAPVFGFKNADSAKSQKSKCMKSLRSLKDRLCESGVFDEDTLKAVAMRAYLKDILREEEAIVNGDFAAAAFDPKDEE